MIGVIALSVAVGIIINRLGDRGLPLRIFFDAVYDVTMVFNRIVGWHQEPLLSIVKRRKLTFGHVNRHDSLTGAVAEWLRRRTSNPEGPEVE
ncbi:hypothetical protein ACOMHN_019592 [Nucella lapillus]